MSEVAEQAEELKELARALIEARAELSKAEQAAQAYANAVAAGTEAANVARAAELEAQRVVARAAADKAAAVLRAEADGSAAAARAAAEAKKTAEAVKQAAEVEKQAKLEAQRVAEQAERERMRALRDEQKAVEEAAKKKAAADKQAEEERARAAENANRAIEAAEKKREAAEAARAQKSQAVKGFAVGAIGGEETVEKYNKAREAMKLAGDASLTGGQRAVAMASGLKFAAGAAMALAGATVGAAAGMIELDRAAMKANADLYLQDQRLEALRGSLDQMRTATAGAVDVQAAFNLRFALAERGLAANAQQMAMYARAIREYSNTRQVSQEQASAAFQRALDGDSTAAAGFGLQLSSATSASQRMALANEQLARSQRFATTERMNAAEAARQHEQAEERASNKIKSALGQIAGILLPPIAIYRDGVRDLARYDEWARRNAETTAGVTDEQRKQEAAVRDLARARAADNALVAARTADQARAAAVSQGLAAAELERMGAFITSAGEALSAQQQYTQALNEMATLQRREREPETEFAQRRLAATNALTAAIKRKLDEESRSDSVRRAEAEAGMLARQLRAHGMVVSARIASITPAQRLLQIQRELAEFAGREGEEASQTAARFQQLAQEAEALRQRGIEAANRARDTRDAQEEYNALVSTADRLEIKRAATQRRAGEQQLEYLQRIIPLQRELNEAEWTRRDAEREALVAAREADARVAAARAAQVAQENEASVAEIQRRTQALGELNVQRETWANEAANSSSLRALEARTRNAITGGDSEVIAREIRARAAMMEQLLANGADRTQEGAARLERLRAEAEAVQRIGTAWRDASDATLVARQAFGLAGDQSLTATQAMIGGAKSAYDAFGELGAGIVDALRQAEKAGEDGGAAVVKRVDEWAEAKAVQWGLQALEALAGAGVAYFIRPDAVPGLLASAATYASLAGVAAATAFAIPSAPAEAGKNGGGSDRERGLGMAASSRSDIGEGRGQNTYVFNVSGLIHTEQVTEAVAGVVRDAEARGLLGGYR